MSTRVIFASYLTLLCVALIWFAVLGLAHR